MERELFIIRHGKSSWDYPDLADIDRPLSERGIRASNTMARRLLERGTVPSLLYASPANRALNTALIMCRVWETDPSCLHIHEQIYEAYVSELEAVVARTPAGETSLAVFGHNPTFTVYANKFLEEPLDNLPTAGVVHLVFESESWSGLNRAHVKREWVDTPKRKHY
jgi:phosphohistidine phosphatase